MPQRIPLGPGEHEEIAFGHQGGRAVAVAKNDFLAAQAGQPKPRSGFPYRVEIVHDSEIVHDRPPPMTCASALIVVATRDERKPAKEITLMRS